MINYKKLHWYTHMNNYDKRMIRFKDVYGEVDFNLIDFNNFVDTYEDVYHQRLTKNEIRVIKNSVDIPLFVTRVIKTGAHRRLEAINFLKSFTVKDKLLHCNDDYINNTSIVAIKNNHQFVKAILSNMPYIFHRVKCLFDIDERSIYPYRRTVIQGATVCICDYSSSKLNCIVNSDGGIVYRYGNDKVINLITQIMTYIQHPPSRLLICNRVTVGIKRLMESIHYNLSEESKLIDEIIKDLQELRD